MQIYSLNDKKLKLISQVNPTDYKEEHIQNLIEQNLDEVFGLEFVCTEFSLKGFRIDTLAFNQETQSFVIIEYKRDKSFSIIDQGYAYLSLMLNNKDSFILEYQEKTGKSLKRDQVDWESSRVFFIANSFSNYQQKALNFQGLPFQLWEVQKYHNSTIGFRQIIAEEGAAKLPKLAKNPTIEAVSKEVKGYTIENHFHEDWEKSRELFEELREKIINLDSRIQENPMKAYIGYKIGKSNVVALGIHKSSITLALPRVRPEDLKDPDSKVTYQENSKEYKNVNISKFTLENIEDTEYAMFLIKQLLSKFFKNNL